MSIRDEARREYVRGAIGPSVGTIADRLGDAWEAGAEWQASREPTDAEVEAAVKALRAYSDGYPEWRDIPEPARRVWRYQAETALRAARGQG